MLSRLSTYQSPSAKTWKELILQQQCDCVVKLYLQHSANVTHKHSDSKPLHFHSKLKCNQQQSNHFQTTMNLCQNKQTHACMLVFHLISDSVKYELDFYFTTETQHQNIISIHQTKLLQKCRLDTKSEPAVSVWPWCTVNPAVHHLATTCHSK